MAKATITVEGFVAKEPETRDAGQHQITTVTIPVAQGRKKDGVWVPDKDQDGKEITAWWEAEFWNEHGRVVAGTIAKGELVTVTGEARPRAYVKKDGTAGQALVIVRGTIAVVVREPSRNGGSQAPQGGFNGGSQPAGMMDWGGQQNTPQGNPGGSGFGSGFDENPF